jgi:hypothetical protein
LDSNKSARFEMLFADTIEDGHTGTQQRRNLGWVHFFGDANGSLSTQYGIFSQPAIARDAVYLAIVAVLDMAAVALAADRVMSGMKCAANTFTAVEVRHASTKLDNIADKLVPRYTWENIAHVA